MHNSNSRSIKNTPPKYSARIYCRIDPVHVAMFRFLLEAEDNLGLMSVVDRWRAVLAVRFSPDQEKFVREHLAGMRKAIPFEIIDLPRKDEYAHEQSDAFYKEDHV